MNFSIEERQRRRERAISRNYRHGFAVRDVDRPPEYAVWMGIKGRCYDVKNKDYRRYGARGIVVCVKWLTSFAYFYSDMGPRPTPKHQIERKNNDGPYSPDNCIWATAIEQARNRRSSVYITFGGRRLTQVEWSQITGIGMTTISWRLAAGWPIEQVLTKKPKYRKKRECTPYQPQ